MLSIIQARMSSERLPGKMMQDVCGRVLIGRVVDQVRKVNGISKIVVATSSDSSDDELENFCIRENLLVYRGSLLDVASRFLEIAKKHNAESFVRVCGDSPVIDPKLIEKLITIFADKNFDLVTNVFPRTFPKGQSVEVIRTNAFESIYSSSLSNEQKEHVTKFFYDNSSEFQIYNFLNVLDFSNINLSVDTLEDLIKIRDIFLNLPDKNFTWQDLIDTN